MFKTGIYQRDCLTMTALRGFFGRRKFVAVTLYPEIASGNDPDRDRLLEHILCRFATANGTYKRTQSHRFDEFDAQVIQILRGRLDPGSRCAIHDMAVSDGRTAVEFFQGLASIDCVELAFLATDAFADLMVVSSPPKALAVVIDPESGAPVQIIRPPFVFNVERHESILLYPVNRLVLDTILRTSVRVLLKRFAVRDPELKTAHVRLLSPECLQLLKADSRFHFERYSILEPAAERFNLVRAMNVLNRSYFSEADLHLAAKNVHESLLPGGLFVTGSNEDAGSPVDGAVYERTQTGFRTLWVSGTGSQMDDILLRQRSA